MDKLMEILTRAAVALIPVLKKSDSTVGVKETKEALIGLNEVSLVLANKFKDGVQFNDFTQLYFELKDDEEFKSAIEAAWDKHQSIPDEFKDIDAGESLELAVVQVEYLPKFKKALSGE